MKLVDFCTWKWLETEERIFTPNFFSLMLCHKKKKWSGKTCVLKSTKLFNLKVAVDLQGPILSKIFFSRQIQDYHF